MSDGERKDKGLHMDSATEIPSLLCPPDYLLFIYSCLLQPHLHICLMGSTVKVYSSAVFIMFLPGL